MVEWLGDHPALVWSLLAASLLVFIGSLLVIPALVVRIPAEYFMHEKRPASRWANQHPLTRLLVRLVKNVLGCLFLLAGVVMLALPGQGLLTMLVGVLMIDFPGKYHFEKWLVQRRWMLRSVNWLRIRRGREPLQFEVR